MKFFKKSLAVLLAVLMLSGSFTCFAAFELNQDAVNLHKGQYKNYLLLGDSVASGYRDEMSDDDARNNDLYMDSTYCRYEGSYADVLADAIIEPTGGKMTALAGPGFRTIEMRYMLEDDFAATCTDEYLFNPSHLYVYEDQVCDCHGVNMTPGSEHFRDAFKNAIKEADLITLGLGGNDWGAYLGWVISDLLEEEAMGDEYIAEARELLDGKIADMATVEKLLEIAHYAGLLAGENSLAIKLLQALEYGLSNFYANWDKVIEDIYALNPNVTLMVVGMSDNSVKGKNYDYNGVEGAPVAADEIPEDLAPVVSIVIDAIMTIGNTPMIEGAKKYGYTYVDTDGTSYVESHPDADGHKFIANKIIEALPHPDFATKYTDVQPGHKYYTSIQYLLSNGIMEGVSETEFAPDEALTTGQLNAAINAITGSEKATDGDSKVSILKLAIALVSAGAKKGGIMGFIKGYGLFIKAVSAYGFKMGTTITRGEAAFYLKSLAEI